MNALRLRPRCLDTPLSLRGTYRLYNTLRLRPRRLDTPLSLRGTCRLCVWGRSRRLSVLSSPVHPRRQYVVLSRAGTRPVLKNFPYPFTLECLSSYFAGGEYDFSCFWTKGPYWTDSGPVSRWLRSVFSFFRVHVSRVQLRRSRFCVPLSSDAHPSLP